MTDDNVGVRERCGREDGLCYLCFGGTGLGCVWILYFRAVAWLALVEAMHSYLATRSVID